MKIKPNEVDVCPVLINEMYNKIYKENIQDSFFICDLGTIIRQYCKFNTNLPRVKPYYAIKCNPNIEMIKTLSSLGCGFDCASRGEIELVLSLGISPQQIIYANPCKEISHIVYAYEHGVNLMTFDNKDELLKIKTYHPHAKMILRIRIDDSRSICPFGIKFGCSVGDDSSLILLQEAKDLHLDVIGVSFHVGSGCLEPMAFHDAIQLTKLVFEQGKKVGHSMEMIDIGGGFPGVENESIQKEIQSEEYTVLNITFKNIAENIHMSLEKYFPLAEYPELKIIAEPGRFFAAPAFTLVNKITSRRIIQDTKKQFMYYINDGVYGSFNCIIFDSMYCQPNVLVHNGKPFEKNHNIEHELYKSSIWGQTCDSLDSINQKVYLPELQIGDWFYFYSMGAYTLASSSQFNGFSPPKIFYIQTSETLNYP